MRASSFQCKAAGEGHVGNTRASRAFTLLEVMIALGIFFMFAFSILAMVSNTVRNARSLRRPQIDAGMAASEFVATNRFHYGSRSGDFGDVLENYSWDSEFEQFRECTNLGVAVVTLKGGNRHEPPQVITILKYDPNLQTSTGRPR
jgi:hypothetical protein